MKGRPRNTMTSTHLCDRLSIKSDNRSRQNEIVTEL